MPQDRGPLSRAAADVLGHLYRSGAPDAATLAAITLVEESDLVGVLDELARAGLILRDGDRLEALPPHELLRSASREIAARAADLAAAHDRLVTGSRSTLDTVTALLGDWQTRSAGLPDDVSASPQITFDRWFETVSAVPARRPVACHPDLSYLRDVVVPGIDRVRGAIAAGMRFRNIIRPEDSRDPVVETLIAVGVEVRALSPLPGWFYADAGVVAAVPLPWGSTVPVSAMVIRATPVIDAIAAFGESLWSRATSVPLVDAGWRSVMPLLERGYSDEAIAAASGQSVRTVRRRIAQAMEHFGATSRFALGAAWARGRDTTSPRP